MDLVKVVKRLRGTGAELEDVEAMKALGGAKATLPATLAAFANSDGGVVIVGLDEDQGYKATGVANAATVRNSLLGIGRDKLTPEPVMSVETMPFENVNLVVAEIEPLPPSQGPCYVKAKGLYAGAYARVGGEDQKLTPYEIDRMKENQGQPRWDSEPVTQASRTDLDRDFCARLIENARHRSPRAFANLTETDALVMLGVLVRHEGSLVPSLAGLLSVGKYPQQFFPQLMVTVAVHPADQRGARAGKSRLADSATLTGAIPGMVADAVEVVRRHLNMVGRVEGAGWADRPEIEPEVIWESIANALMHRDYSPQARGSQVQVDLFPGRLEVSNPGGLFGNVRPGTLGESGTSSSRNPRLAALLEETIDPVTGFAVAENRGGGIAMMINRTRESTGIVPLLDAGVDRFRTVVPRSSPVTPQFLSALGRHKAAARLSDVQTAALALAHWGYDIDPAVLRRLGLSPSGARVELANLVTLGLLRAAKSGSDGPYRLNIELKAPTGPRAKLREKSLEKSLERSRATQVRDEFPLPRGKESPARVLESGRPEVPSTELRILEPRIPEDQSPRERIMTALRDLDEASRRELQKATGLSRGELTDELQELLDAGLVESSSARGPVRRYQVVDRNASSTS